MRGKDESSLFSYVDLEARVPRGHPLRAIRDLTNAALAEMSGESEALYSRTGRPGIAPVFTKNRERLLAGDVASRFLAQLVSLPAVKRLLSQEHFSVDGTQIEAWASIKSFRAVDEAEDDDSGDDAAAGGGRNAARDFHGAR